MGGRRKRRCEALNCLHLVCGLYLCSSLFHFHTAIVGTQKWVAESSIPDPTFDGSLANANADAATELLRAARQGNVSLSTDLSEYTCTGLNGSVVTLPTGLPHFIIMGAQKAGTSALYRILQHHSQLQASSKFEPHFFDFHLPRDHNLTAVEICDLRQDYVRQNFEASLRAFQENGTQTLAYEKTPSYLAHPSTFQNLKKILFWKIKLVVLLRNPVERFFSAYNMPRPKSKSKTPKLSVEETIQEQVSWLRQANYSQAPNRLDTNNDWQEHLTDFVPKLAWDQRPLLENYTGILPRGIYVDQVRALLNVFPRQDVWIVPYEALLNDTAAFCQDLFEFVGAAAPESELPSEIFKMDYSPNRGQKLNGRTESSMAPETRAWLQHFYRPYNEELADLLGEEWLNIWED